MPTQAIINVLLIATVANVFIIVALMVGPRVQARWERRGQATRKTADRPVPRPPDATSFAAARDPAGDGGGAGAESRAERFDVSGGPNSASPRGSLHLLPVDPMTDLDLAPSWAMWLEEENARIARYHRPATVVIIEVSGLDRLAERLGREAAERLIPPVAMTMRRNARAADRLARLGPSRFGAILVETDEISAINYVERVRAACDVWLAAGAVALRLSIGWAEIRADRSADLALVEAEQRLFVERPRTRLSEVLAPIDSREPAAPLLQASGS